MGRVILKKKEKRKNLSNQKRGEVSQNKKRKSSGKRGGKN
jgi:hypothetical protein